MENAALFKLRSGLREDQIEAVAVGLNFASQNSKRNDYSSPIKSTDASITNFDVRANIYPFLPPSLPNPCTPLSAV